jgi:hypothetical protein
VTLAWLRTGLPPSTSACGYDRKGNVPSELFSSGAPGTGGKPTTRYTMAMVYHLRSSCYENSAGCGLCCTVIARIWASEGSDLRCSMAASSVINTWKRHLP